MPSRHEKHFSTKVTLKLLNTIICFPGKSRYLDMKINLIHFFSQKKIIYAMTIFLKKEKSTRGRKFAISEEKNNINYTNNRFYVGII